MGEEQKSAELSQKLSISQIFIYKYNLADIRQIILQIFSFYLQESQIERQIFYQKTKKTQNSMWSFKKISKSTTTDIKFMENYTYQYQKHLQKVKYLLLANIQNNFLGLLAILAQINLQFIPNSPNSTKQVDSLPSIANITDCRIAKAINQIKSKIFHPMKINSIALLKEQYNQGNLQLNDFNSNRSNMIEKYAFFSTYKLNINVKEDYEKYQKQGIEKNIHHFLKEILNFNTQNNQKEAILSDQIHLRSANRQLQIYNNVQNTVAISHAPEVSIENIRRAEVQYIFQNSNRNIVREVTEQQPESHFPTVQSQMESMRPQNERQEMRTDYQNVGIIYAIWKDTNGIEHKAQSTAFLISQSELVTCTHAVCDLRTRKYCDEYIFIPGCPEKDAKRKVELVSLKQEMVKSTIKLFPNKLSRQSEQFEFTMIKLEKPILLRQYFKLASAEEVKLTAGSELRLIGYHKPTLSYERQTGMMNIEHAPRLTLDGPVSSLVEQGSILRHSLPTEQGMSGSPILIKECINKGIVIGIHTGGAADKNSYNSALYFSKNIFKTITNFKQTENDLFRS